MVALDYSQRLGHDNHRRICKVHGWEGKKTKATWGAEIVEYGKTAKAAVQKMTAADLNAFLVVCALVSDLSLPGYDAQQPLKKDSHLATTAARHKVEATKIVAAVRAELTKEKEEQPGADKTTKSKSVTTPRRSSKPKQRK
jgi:hypothetical protein